MQKLDIVPIGKPRMTQNDKWKPAARNYFKYAHDLQLLTGPQILKPPIDVIFHIPMPKSWSQKYKRRMGGEPHTQKPDIDNFIKAFLDALCEDDSYIYDIRGRKFWTYQELAGITIIHGLQPPDQALPSHQT